VLITWSLFSPYHTPPAARAIFCLSHHDAGKTRLFRVMHDLRQVLAEMDLDGTTDSHQLFQLVRQVVEKQAFLGLS